MTELCFSVCTFDFITSHHLDVTLFTYLVISLYWKEISGDIKKQFMANG